MTLAFKEWSYIVDALGKGEQNLIIRKGGISEDEGDFKLKGKQFLLLPTLFHQAKDLIKPEWLPKLSGDRFHSKSNMVLLDYFAEVIQDELITDWETLQKLYPYHAWKEEIILERFNRWNKNVHLLFVQVYKLEYTKELELLPEYGGCKSWAQIEEDILLEGKPIKYLLV